MKDRTAAASLFPPSAAMQIKLAQTAGFCMGVKRAIDRALSEAPDARGPVYSLGPLIHNPQAVEVLERRGIRAIDSIDGIREGTVIIRAHGIPPATRAAIEAAGLKIVDATCPHVLHSQAIIRKHHQEGCRIVIAGDRDHAEVMGLQGYCDNAGVVVSTPEEARGLRLEGRICLIAQTTFNEAAYGEIAGVLKAGHNNVLVVQTICKSTEERQREVIELAKSVDAMVVVGGRNSANTRRLAEIARETRRPAIHVETAAELPADVASYRTVGVTAGASTPSWVTASVIRRLQEMSRPTRPTARALGSALRGIIHSNIYTGFGAAALTYACFALQFGPGASPDPLHLAIAFSYIFSVYVWNRMSKKQLDEANAPPRVAFYAGRPKLLIVVSALLAALSLGVAASMGLLEAILLLAAYLIGLAYNIPLAPAWLKYRRLRDIPASKDIFAAAGWAAVAVVIPAIAYRPPLAAALLAGLAAFILSFVRTALFDFTDIQGDRLLGRETLPVLLGADRARAHLALMAGLLAAVLAGAAAAGIFKPLGYLLLPCPALIVLVLYPLFGKVVKSELVCPLVADGLLLLAGGLAALWRVLA